MFPQKEQKEPTLSNDLSICVQQPNNGPEKHSPAQSSSEDDDHNQATALDTEVVHADFCPDDDDVSAPNPIALACSRAIAPGDPPWPTRQEFEQRRVESQSEAP